MVRDSEIEAKQMDDGADQPRRKARRNTARKVSAVAIARAE
jgi:hypothetical protein